MLLALLALTQAACADDTHGDLTCRSQYTPAGQSVIGRTAARAVKYGALINQSDGRLYGLMIGFYCRGHPDVAIERAAHDVLATPVTLLRARFVEVLQADDDFRRQCLRDARCSGALGVQ
ncbi:MAG: hypothetical protein M3Y41_15550 [Pseudomonadota bacterium]|nr:hypothetical protein [Pseudomonadota bacterium]